jgi:hypothetical protein
MSLLPTITCLVIPSFFTLPGRLNHACRSKHSCILCSFLRSLRKERNLRSNSTTLMTALQVDSIFVVVCVVYLCRGGLRRFLFVRTAITSHSCRRLIDSLRSCLPLCLFVSLCRVATSGRLRYFSMYRPFTLLFYVSARRSQCIRVDC